MPLDINYKKKNIFIFFSFGVSLKTWSKQKILKREIKYYQELKKKNYNVTFVTYGDETDLKYKRYLNDINVLPLFKNLKKNFLTKYLILLFGPFILKKELNNCDLIKTHQITGGLLAILCAKFKNKKIIVRTGWEPTFNHRNWNINFVKYLILIINSFLSYKLSNKIIVTSNEIKNFINTKYYIDLKKIVLIPNAINIKKFRNFKIQKYDNRIISISRLESQKNLFTLLNICKLSKLNLDIIGTGTQLSSLKKFAKKNHLDVRFFGQIENNKIPNYLSKYKLYLTSSKIEGSPKTILEAMSVELPIFGLKAYGLNSLVQNGKTGYLYSNIKNLSKKLIELKNKKKVLNSLGLNARALIKKNFSLKKNVKLERETIEKLFNEKKYRYSNLY